MAGVQTNWDSASGNSSRAIIVWESSDLIHWTDERPLTVEDEAVGMAWAPDVVWMPHGESILCIGGAFAEDDSSSSHTGDPVMLNSLRSDYTSDFRVFTSPQTYISLGEETAIDLSFLQINESIFVRYYVDGPTTSPVPGDQQGLFGEWTTLDGKVDNSASFEALCVHNAICQNITLS
ncbi:uncharacterized protein BJX67DRAFT_385008 [Aspergillus lucknowensis]|uniref:Uncharacterized protein n=1 Tax=Aspergillus lucknowensis TaxID=176173 RepID=A0ABR4LF33_9EURO